MANFNEAQAITGKTEYGYNPGIGEAQTINGVDRSQNPKWQGWTIVDNILNRCPQLTPHQLNLIFDADTELQNMILSFFKVNYWDVLSLDEVNDQQVANTCYDCSINQGSGIAARFMQIACNALHVPVIVDGQIGSKTLAAINSINPVAYYDEINTLREARYKASNNKEWIADWLSRLTPYIS